jgi:hypothetical protein
MIIHKPNFYETDLTESLDERYLLYGM